MKKTFLNLVTAFCFATLVISCESDKKPDADTDNADTVIMPAEPVNTDTVKVTPADSQTIVNENKKPAAQKKSTAKTPAPAESQPQPQAPQDWRSMLKEYHEILCRNHKGKGTNEDKIRQAELSSALMDERRKLAPGEQFKFTAEMARAANMENCK